MSVMQLAVAAALAVLASSASAADSAGSVGQCAVAADHVMLQAKTNVHPLKKLSAQAKLVQETNKGDMESKLASTASANSTDPLQDPEYIGRRFEGECNPQNLRNAPVTAVYNIVGGVHESFVVHVNDGSPTGLAMMLEVGKSSKSGFEPIFAIRCESMPWVRGFAKSDWVKGSEGEVAADVAQVGNCLSEIGVLPKWATVVKRITDYDATGIFADWTQPCGDGVCPCNSAYPGTEMLRRGTIGEWKVRNAMILPTKTRIIQFPYTSYGAVADLAKKYALEKFPHQGAEDDYDLKSNNCQHFCAHMFTAVTGDNVLRASKCGERLDKGSAGYLYGSYAPTGPECQ